MRRLTLGAMLVVVGLVAAGCSSSPSPQAAPTTTTTTTTTTLPPTTTTVPPTTSTPAAPTTTTSTTTPPGFGFLAQAASFVTADDGYVMGDIACGARNRSVCLSVQRTSSGGVAWTRVTPPGPPDARNIKEVSDLTFADPTDGWAYGTTLWSTHNAAVGWSHIRIGGAVKAVATAAGEAYALVDPCTGFAPCTKSERIEQTPIGEDAWTRMAPKTASFSQGTTDLVVQGTTVWVLEPATSTEPTARIVRSIDGGPFESLPVPCQTPPAGTPGPMSPASLAATGDTVAVACVGPPSAAASDKQLFVSVNGGASYTRQSDPPAGGLGAAIALANASTVVLTTEAAFSGVYQLAAPSPTWVNTLTLQDQGVGLSELNFVNAQTGFVIDGPAQTTLHELSRQRADAPFGRLYVTHNAGASWTAVTVPM